MAGKDYTKMHGHSYTLDEHIASMVRLRDGLTRKQMREACVAIHENGLSLEVRVPEGLIEVFDVGVFEEDIGEVPIVKEGW